MGRTIRIEPTEAEAPKAVKQDQARLAAAKEKFLRLRAQRKAAQG